MYRNTLPLNLRSVATRTARSFKHEYGLFIEQEIENYKESIPRGALLAIGDEAATKLASAAQFQLTELLLCEEVDRLIARRLRLPAYATWKKKRLKLHEEMRRPEHWGLSKNDALARIGTKESRASRSVVVAGDEAAKSALFLAANGCEVTTVEFEEEAVERVMVAAVQAGLAERLHPVPSDLSQFTPAEPLHAVVCSHAALDALSPLERSRVLAVLQSATLDGGVHLVETIAAGSAALEELRATYQGWDVSIENRGESKLFMARKDDASPRRRVSQ